MLMGLDFSISSFFHQAFNKIVFIFPHPANFLWSLTSSLCPFYKFFVICNTGLWKIGKKFPGLQIWILVFNDFNDCWLEFDVEFRSSQIEPRSTVSHMVNYHEHGFCELTLFLWASVKQGSSHHTGWFFGCKQQRLPLANLKEFIGGIASFQNELKFEEG